MRRISNERAKHNQLRFFPRSFRMATIHCSARSRKIRHITKQSFRPAQKKKNVTLRNSGVEIKGVVTP